MDINVKTEMIKRWATERGINQDDSMNQAYQIGKEYVALCEGMAKESKEQIIDSIGSLYVGLTFLCMQEGIDIGNCIEHGYEEIKEGQGNMVDGLVREL